MSKLLTFMLILGISGCMTGVPGEQPPIKNDQPVPGPQGPQGPPGPQGPAGDSFIAAWALIGTDGQVFSSGGAPVLSVQRLGEGWYWIAFDLPPNLPYGVIATGFGSHLDGLNTNAAENVGIQLVFDSPTLVVELISLTTFEFANLNNDTIFSIVILDPRI